jgi:hypothetical protein
LLYTDKFHIFAHTTDSTMDFKFRLESKTECYDKLVGWWKTHEAFEGKFIPYSSMPNRIFTVYKDEIDLYSVAVYITDSDMCWIGWITSNPASKIKSRYKALEYLYEQISNTMKSQGFSIVISKTKQSGLMKTLTNTGFINIEPSTNFYIKNL